MLSNPQEALSSLALRCYSSSCKAKKPSQQFLFFEQSSKSSDPVIVVFTGLTHPDRNVVFLPEIQIALPHALILCGPPVFVPLVKGIGVEGWAKDVEVSVPLSSLENQDVAFIFFANDRGHSFVERFQQRI
jgi:hypothetical protein